MISLVNRYCSDPINRGGVVFELGCGSGPNIPFIQSLFSSFDIISLEEKIINIYEPKNNHQFSSWNIVARKR
jgi:hypothetical protein